VLLEERLLSPLSDVASPTEVEWSCAQVVAAISQGVEVVLVSEGRLGHALEPQVAHGREAVVASVGGANACHYG
jgi:hypothetical protein